jgi:CPA2 family monovalent cation:H+ antiporter-2
MVLLLAPLLAPLAAESTLPFLAELVALLAASALIGYLCQRIGLVPIVGFLVAGVLLSPNTFGIIRDQPLIEAAAEIGVILLLFTIGIEFSLDQLARIRRLIFVGGGLQVGLVIAIVTVVLLLFRVPWQVGVFTGCLVALSSTAVVMKLLADRGETTASGGQIALGMLIFQDLAVVAMVLVVPMLSGTGGSVAAVVQALATAVGIIGGVLVVARRVMPPLLEAVARTCSQEVFLLSVSAICFGTAYLTSLAGVSLSLGAFLAGLLVSDTRFKEYALGEILPLQVLFSATFFVSVGLLRDVRFLLQNLPLVALVLGAVVLIKVVTTAASVRLLGYGGGVAAFASLLLAQIGEFSLVLERTGGDAGLTPAGLGETGTQTFIAATVILIIATPFLAQAGAAFQQRLATRADKPTIDQDGDGVPDANGFATLTDHVILAGYGAAAQALAPVLQNAGVPYGIVTLSPGGANAAEEVGYPVLRSDYTRPQTLTLAGIMRARLLVVADDTPAMAERVVAVVRGIHPTLPIIARTRFVDEADGLTAAGADHVVADEHASVTQMANHVLRAYDRDVEQIVGATPLRMPQQRTNGVAPRAAPVRLRDAAYGTSRCTHVRDVTEVVPMGTVCADCVQQGDRWVHLRVCMRCGYVGCCDSSKNKHAAQHFAISTHPVMRSLEPGEAWGWCYVDRLTL